jgi:hypothetical protein
MIFYVLLTHGAKPRGKINNHPAARAQLANLSAYWESVCRDGQSPDVVYDYQRKITGLSSLPNLSLLLEKMKAAGQGVVLMDNVARLISACHDEYQPSLVNELIDHGNHIAGLRQGGSLSGMNEFYLTMLATGQQTPRYTFGDKRPRKNMSERDRRHQTFKATLVSRKARGGAADKKARELDAIREDLTRTHEKPTLKMIAEEANTRGLTTTRGGSWSSSTVGRTLKRLDETPQIESDTNDQAQE